jgi:hypothetical protein
MPQNVSCCLRLFEYTGAFYKNNKIIEIKRTYMKELKTRKSQTAQYLAVKEGVVTPPSHELNTRVP